MFQVGVLGPFCEKSSSHTEMIQMQIELPVMCLSYVYIHFLFAEPFQGKLQTLWQFTPQ